MPTDAKTVAIGLAKAGPAIKIPAACFVGMLPPELSNKEIRLISLMFSGELTPSPPTITSITSHKGGFFYVETTITMFFGDRHRRTDC